MAKEITFLNNNSVANIDNNFARVNTALEDVLSLSGELPNSMGADIDLNGNDIINVDNIHAETLVLNNELVAPSTLTTIAPNSVGASQIVDGSVGTAELADGSVTTVKLEDGSVTLKKLDSSTVSISFDNKTTAEAYAPVTAPNFIRIEGYTTAGDGGGALYKKVASEPSHAGKFSITLADGLTVVWYEIAEGRITPLMFGAVGDGVTDDVPAIQAAHDFTGGVLFWPEPPVQWRFKTPMVLGNFVRWIGDVPQSTINAGTARIELFASKADFVDGDIILRFADDGSSTQSHIFRNLSFRSDSNIVFNDLANAESTGVVFVDVSGAKQGIEFIDCLFRQVRNGIDQSSDTPYLDKVTLTRCKFSMCYMPIQVSPTAGLSLIDVTFDDCFQFVNAFSSSTSPLTVLSMVNVRHNNSSFASETTGYRAGVILVEGGYGEGGNSVFQPSHRLSVNGFYASETFSASGSTKFLIKPQADGALIEYRNSRVPTNTRFINMSGLTRSTLKFNIEGVYGGTNFGDLASVLSFYLGEIDYQGWGNANDESWNYRGRPYKASLTANYTVGWADINQSLRTGSAITVTLPANASVALPIGFRFRLFNLSSANNVTLTTSDTLLGSAGTGARTFGSRASGWVEKVGVTTWQVFGDGIA